MLQTYENSVAYGKHKATIELSMNTPACPKDYIKLVQEKQNSLKRTRQFEDHNKFKDEEKQNLRMLNKFVEI